MSTGVEKSVDARPPSAWWVVGGALGGLLLGAGVGAPVGDLTYKPEPYSLFDYGRGFNVLVAAILGGVIGLSVGALFSFLWRTHRTRQQRFERERRSFEAS